MQTQETWNPLTLLTHPDNTKLKANYINVDPVNIDSDRLQRWELYVALNHVLGLHLKGREGLINMAVLGEGVGAVALKGVIIVIKCVVKSAHDPAGAWLCSWSRQSSSAKSWNKNKMYLVFFTFTVSIG